MEDLVSVLKGIMTIIHKLVNVITLLINRMLLQMSFLQ